MNTVRTIEAAPRKLGDFTIPRKPVPVPQADHEPRRDPQRPFRVANDSQPYIVDGSESWTEDKQALISKQTGITSDSDLGPNELWRPFWLHRRVLLGFVVVFLLPIIPIQILLSVSQRQQGIATPKEDLYYLWTFSLTAVLVVLAPIWGRIEYQAMAFTPWIAMAKRPTPGPKSVFLSYLSMQNPVAIFVSIKNRHFLVTITALVSLIIKLQIVLSTGLFFLSPIPQLVDNIPIRIQSSFIDDVPSVARDPDSIPKIVADNSGGLNITFIPGMGSNFAYQLFDSDDYPSNYQPIQAVVDGLSLDVECEPATLTGEPVWLNQYPGQMTGATNLTVTSPLCSKPLTYQAQMEDFDQQATNYQGMIDYLGFGNRSLCDPQGPDRILAMQMTFAFEYWVGLHVQSYMALICTPIATLSKVEVVKFGKNVTVSLASDPKNRTVTGAISELLASTQQYPVPATGRVGDGPNENYLPQFLLDAEPLVGRINFDPWLNSTYYENALRKWFQKYGVSIAHYKFSQREDFVSPIGTAYLAPNRLLVQPLYAHIISAVFGLMAALSLLVGLCLVEEEGFVPRDPGTLFGTAIIVANSTSYLGRFARKGVSPVSMLADDAVLFETSTHGSSSSTYKGRVFELRSSASNKVAKRLPIPNIHGRDAPWYTPWLVGRLSRIAMCILIAGLISGLIVTLQRSEKQDGLGFANSVGYLHFVWTSLPTFVMVGISLYFSSCDSITRSLDLFSSLKERPCTVEEADIAVDDMLAVSALYYSIRRGKFGLFLSTTLLLLTGFLTIFAGVLFTPVLTTSTYDISLQAETWFSSLNLTSESYIRSHKLDMTGMLLLADNFSWPQWSYHDLAFPQLQLVGGMSDSLATNVPITTTLRATQYTSNCTQFPYETLEFYTTPALDVDVPSWNYWIKTSGSNASGFIDLMAISNNDTMFQPVETVYFGSYYDKIWPTSDINSDFDVAYAWGVFNHTSVSTAPNFTVSHIVWAHMVGCHRNLVEVDIDVTFTGTDLHIDNDHPPVVHSSTASPVPYDIAIFMPAGVEILNSTDKAPYHFVADMFQPLFGPRLGFEVADLTDEAKALNITKGLADCNNVMLAQSLNAWNRKFFNQSSELVPFTQDQPPPVTAAVHYSEYRLVQNRRPTYFLISLLSAIFVLNLVALVTGRTRVVPKDPRSIAAVSSLLADSNIFEYLPYGAEWMDMKKLATYFSGKQLRMGWFLSAEGQQRFTIGIMDEAPVLDNILDNTI